MTIQGKVENILFYYKAIPLACGKSPAEFVYPFRRDFSLQTKATQDVPM